MLCLFNGYYNVAGCGSFKCRLQFSVGLFGVELQSPRKDGKVAGAAEEKSSSLSHNVSVVKKVVLKQKS